MSKKHDKDIHDTHKSRAAQQDVPDELRQRAEQVLRRRKEDKENFDREKQDLVRLVHELEVHQVELEMQADELRQARGAAEVSRDRFHILFRRAPVGYLILDSEGTIKRSNQAAAELLTAPAVGLKSRNFLRFIDLDTVDQVHKVFRRTVSRHMPHEVQARLHRPEEEAVHVLIHFDMAEPLLSMKPEVFATLTDVSDLVRARQELERKKEEYRTLVEHLPEIVARFDREGRVVYINQALERVTGIPVSDCLGRSLAESEHVPDSSIFLDALHQAFDSGEDLEICLTWPFPDQERQFRVSLVPEQRNGGSVDTVLAIAMDVTEETMLHRSLEKARERAEQGSRAKSAFLANMSHEIRTPIAGILGMCEVLLKKEEDADKGYRLRMMRDAGKSLLSILNDILDLSRMEAGRFELRERLFSPRDQLARLQALFEPRVTEKGITLSTWVSPRVPDQLVGDPDRISQVLRNLVDNAVKFTAKGSVELTVKAVQTTDGIWTLTYKVKDTGPGIPSEWQERIFENFVQIGTDYAREHGGSGLGLSICTNLVDLMGGRLQVESKKGKGSTFFFTLPLRRPDQEPVPEAERSVGLGPLKILLAEDNPINQLALQETLSDAGHQVRSAYTGEQALEALEEESFDVVLMDVQMPKMDGIEATRIIRTSGKYAVLPIIAFTAYAHEDEKQRFLDAGMDACVSKPIETDELLEVMGKVVEKKAGERG